jgi:monoamine oxidase
MGAEFIGGNHPRWLACAARFGVELVEIDWPATSFVRLGGKLIDGAPLRRLLADYHALGEQMTELARGVDDERPWQTPDAAELDRLSLADGIASRLQGDELAKRMLLLKFHQSEAAPPEKISWLGQLTAIKGHGLAAYWEETERYRCRGGVEQLAHKLATDLPEVRCNAVVTAVEYDGGRATATLSDGQAISSDWLILALPPSQWARIDFTPRLPDATPLRLGAASKEFVRLRQEFWSPGHAPLASSDDPQGGLYQTLAEPTDDGSACLEWYVAGAPAEGLGDLAPAKRKQRILDAVRPALPELETNWLDWHSQDWRNEPFADGAYSFAQLGKAVEWGPTLYHGIGRMRFAGEHASFRFPGYMEGALESAQRCVRSIAEAGV